MTKRRPSWSERLRWAATLVCGLLLLNLPEAVWAAATKVAAVNAKKMAKKPALEQAVAHRPVSKNSRKKKAKTAASARLEPDADVGVAEMRVSDDFGLRGSASFYGQGFHGRRSANGERFDARAFTAASNHFALGSWVAVRRLDSERCAIVRVNDRMHARHQRRIIDVSRGVAEYLDMVRAGVVLVRVAALKSGDHNSRGSCKAAFDSDADCPDCNQPPRLPPQGLTAENFPLP